jgi:hypothetical protein
MNMDILLILLLAGMAFYAGVRLATIWQQMVFKKILDDLGVTDKQLHKLTDTLADDETETEVDGETIKLKIMEIKIEEHQGQLYAYKLEDDQFLGQGKSREDLLESLKANLTNVKLIISEENGSGYIKPTSGA